MIEIYLLTNIESSEETRLKMSESAKRRAATPEGLARLRAASMKALEAKK